MQTDNHYDVVIIGSGAGSGTIASKLAPTGKKILLIGWRKPQERLNNVFGAVCGASAPEIEFLEYLASRAQRPYPADEKPNDLVHWKMQLVAASTGEIAAGLTKSR